MHNETLWALPEQSCFAVLDNLVSRLAAPHASAAPTGERGTNGVTSPPFAALLAGAALPAGAVPGGQRKAGYTVHGGVAVIPVHGVITRNTMYDWDGNPATAGQNAIRAAFDAAMGDPDVTAVLFSINSPGGVVAGTRELHDHIAANRAKPTAAYADGLMASAAMWLAAATGRVYAPSTATVGSVGVIAMHRDWSRYMEKVGVATTYVTGGAMKAYGNPESPLSDEAAAHMQERVDAIHQMFKADVMRGLAITAPAGEWAEGQTLLAQQAEAIGLVTAIVRDESAAITKLCQEAPMELDYETLAAQHPELVAAIKEKGRLEAKATQEDSAKTAVDAARADLLAMVKIVAGEEAHATLEGLVSAGATPAVLEALGPNFAAAQKAKAAPADPEAAARAEILEGIEAHANKAVSGTMPEVDESAATQAAIDRMAKL